MSKNIAAWLLLMATLILCLTRTTKEVSAQAGPTAEILRLVNQVRANYGLPPFTWDNSLAAAAQNQAIYMATNNIYSHTGAGGSSPASRAIAAGYPGHATENIVGGTDLTPNQGVIWWRNSPTHFNTMISQRYIHAGVGFAQGHDQNFYALVVGVPTDLSPELAPNPQPSGEVLAPVAPVIIAAPREDGSIVHVVGSGQSFWSIAARYEISLDQLYLYNNINESSVINPGDELIIRLAEGQPIPPTPTPPATHKVNDGDSFWTIAAWYNLSLSDLLWLNGMEEDSLLSPGDEIKIRLIPGEEPPPTSTPRTSYTVKSGDTAWGIAVAYGLSVSDLLAYNNMTSNTVLSVGETLLIVPPSPTPTATPIMTATSPPTVTPTATVTPSPIPTVAIQQKVSRQSSPTPSVSAPAGNQNPITLRALIVIFLVGLALTGVGLLAISFLRHSK